MTSPIFRSRFDALLAALLITFAALAAVLPRHRAISLEFEMAVTTSAAGQVFYDAAGQFVEERSVKIDLQPDGRFHTYTVSLPEMNSGAVRLDPGNAPGRVMIRRIGLRAVGTDVAVSGQALHELQVVQHLQVDGGGDVLSLTSTGNDPSLVFQLPKRLQYRSWTRAVPKIATAVASLIALWMLFRHRRRLFRTAQGVVLRHPILTVPAVVAATWGLAALLGVGCPSNACVSSRSFGYGALLTLGMLAFATVGGAMAALLGARRSRPAGPSLVAWILVGQTGLTAYVYVRSIAAGLLPLPITKLEIALLVGAAFVFLLRRTDLLVRIRSSPLALRWTLIRIASLAAIAVWIADRELPRLVMLSSDPEIHALFAKQVERIGGVPRDPQGWVEGAFGYPAGSAVFGYLWSSLSALDVRNVLAALPLVQTLLAALLVAEVVSTAVRSAAVRLLTLLLVLGLTFAGFLFPLYEQYSHMEGLARQASSGTFALFAVLLFAHRRIGVRSEYRGAIALAMVLFTLGVLNPVNIMIPSALVGAYVAGTIARKRLSPVALVPPAVAMLLLLDPYYSALVFGGHGGAAKLQLAGHLKEMTADEVAAAWFNSGANLGSFIRYLVALHSGIPQSLFAVLVVALAALLLTLSHRLKRVGQYAVFAAALALMLWMQFGISSALSGDARFYLLAPYLDFGLLQHKALLLMAMAAVAVVLLYTRDRQFPRAAGLAAALVVFVAAVVRPVQPYRLEPRFDYCGSMGCAASSDLDVIQKLNAVLQPDGHSRVPARVLVPNSVNQMGAEKWLFPVGGARLLAQEADVPLAFYYYHGDKDFTTANYVKHVCTALDRPWLRSERIRYVFLPADRGGACISSVEELVKTERILAVSGNSYLLELR